MGDIYNMVIFKEKLLAIKQIAEKMSVAKEFFEPFIENRYVELPFVAKKFINDFGTQILDIIGDIDEKEKKC